LKGKITSTEVLFRVNEKSNILENENVVGY